MRQIFRGIITFFLFVFSVSNATSAPISSSLNGKTGVLRTLSVRNLIQGSFGINYHASYFQTKDFLSTNTEDVMKSFGGMTAIGIGLADWAELSLAIDGVATSFTNKYTGVDDFYQTFGDLEPGLKFGYMSDAGLGIGIDIFARFLTNINKVGYQFDATSFGGRLLWTLDLDAAKNVPLRFHFNIGFYKDHSDRLTLPNRIEPDAAYAIGFPYESVEEFAGRILHDDQVLGAVALEIPVDEITAYVEYTTRQVLDTNNNNLPSLSYNKSPQVITPGLRFTPVRGFAFDIACDLGLSKPVNLPLTIKDTSDVKLRNVRGAVPQWNAIIGFSYSFLPGAAIQIVKEVTPPPSKGKVTGMVVDSATQRAIGEAIIEMKGTGLTNLSTDPETGTYTTPELPGGEVELIVRKEGYQQQSAKVNVLIGQTVTQDFKLQKEVKVGAIYGRVTDPAGKPLAAVITVNDPSISPGASKIETGEYFMKIPPGDYQITATVQGFKSATKSALVKHGFKTRVDFVMETEAVAPPPPPPVPIEKKPKVYIEKEKIVITETIHFEIGKAVILPISYSILNAVAEVLRQNPNIKVRIEGHTDSIGSDVFNMKLSQARADSVMKYLISQGIDPTRLEAKGYGETLPIADNATPEGRAKNRRVEFTIISQ